MVYFGTTVVDPIHTSNTEPTEPIDKGLISISDMKSNPSGPVKKIRTYDISYDGTTTK